ncbi:hypothetical protein AOQ84DRAFT_265988, partial [Glonium stellatum]
DAVRPEHDNIRRTFERSYNIWFNCVEQSQSKTRLPVQCFQIRNILHATPSLPSQGGGAASLRFYHNSNDDHLFIAGKSTWQTTANKDCDLGPKTIPGSITFGVQSASFIEFSQDLPFLEWPGVDNSEECKSKGNFVAILALAWAYILSTRWVELLKTSDKTNSMSSLQYSSARALWSFECPPHLNSNYIKLNLGGVCDSSARWWSAILAPSQGWVAQTVRDGKTYQSPWSYSLRGNAIFRLDGKNTIQSWCDPPTSQTAIQYLSDFCGARGIEDQSTAALLVVLYFPYLNAQRSFCLPTPKPYLSSIRQLTSDNGALKGSDLLSTLMVLSCNVRGIMAPLCGVFFDPSVTCNLVGPWLQPALNLITPFLKSGNCLQFVTIMAQKQPLLAPLWLGAVILGLERKFIALARYGPPLDLLAGAWTGTPLSFITGEPSNPLITPEQTIRRSDECRMLFITESPNHTRSPISAWPPFGTSKIKDTQIEVQTHARCTHHFLKYRGWSWDLVDGTSPLDPGCYKFPVTDVVESASRLALGEMKLPAEISERESESATRSIFCWLRPYGYPTSERCVFTHEWFDDAIDDEVAGDVAE